MTRIVVVDGGGASPFHLDNILYTNLPAPALLRFGSSLGGGSPLSRMAMRSSQPFLVSTVMSSLARPKAKTWLSQFRQVLADEDFFVVPVRREESLVGIVVLAAPGGLFDSLTCSVLTVLAHAVLFRTEELGAKPRRGERASLTER